jgi:putative pyruvate formate lyase activating enzyme
MKTDELHRRIDALQKVLEDCTLCPRECHIDRTSGDTGYCSTGYLPFVSSWGPHFGEEKPLGEGRDISHEELAGIMLSLQESGCHNINLVTPTHQLAAIVKAFGIARDMGFGLPMVYNSGGYDSVETLKLLEGVMDIYMPDFKYVDGESAAGYSDAPDYPERARAAIREMHRQVGDLAFDGRGIAVRGLLVRHLVLPSGIAGTEEFVRFIAEEISKDTYVNIMEQYHPCHRAFDYPPLDRRLTEKEYSDAVACAVKAGLRRIDGVTT